MQNTTIEKCETCFKPAGLCYCNLTPELSTQLKLVVLQHPQEPKELLSSAPLIAAVLKGVQIKIGLSWPNFKKVVGEAETPADWGVVYLGSGIKFPEGKKIFDLPTLNFVDKKGQLRSPAEQIQMKKQLKGLIFLDGTWAQAKTLWWRNPWLLKLHRVVLKPSSPSEYGKMRKEPKKECLSTLESVALCLDFYNEDKAAKALKNLFLDFLGKIKSQNSRQ
jgi:DTW domain-containing protein YfiP